MGNRYVTKSRNVTPTAGSSVTIITVQANSRRVRVVEIAVAGNGTTSAYQQIEVGRGSSGTSVAGSGVVTPNKFDHTDVPAAACSYLTLASSSAVDTNTEVIGWNALGGANRWIPPKGSGLECRGNRRQVGDRRVD